MLAGAPRTPADLLPEMAEAEELGLGAAFISERYNIKEAATLSGAAAAVSRRIGIATAATNHNTRHPLITASYATTMHRLSGGRFTLGLGRGVDAIFGVYGLPKITTAQMEDIGGPASPALARRGRDRTRRPRRPLPAPAPRRDLRRGHPARPGGLRTQHPVAGRPGLRHGRAAHLLHGRDDDPSGGDRTRPQPRRRGGTRRRSGSGPATPRSPTRFPRTCG